MSDKIDAAFEEWHRGKVRTVGVGDAFRAGFNAGVEAAANKCESMSAHHGTDYDLRGLHEDLVRHRTYRNAATVTRALVPTVEEQPK